MPRRFSNFTQQPLLARDISPHDYVLVPEKRVDMRDWAPLFAGTGALPMVYFLGQHHNRLADTPATRGFKATCLSQYFSRLYGCSPRAVLNTPMNGSFIEAAQTQTNHVVKVGALRPGILHCAV